MVIYLTYGKYQPRGRSSALSDIFSKVGGRLQIVIELSRQIYGKPKAEVKKIINDWLEQEFFAEGEGPNAEPKRSFTSNDRPSYNSPTRPYQNNNRDDGRDFQRDFKPREFNREQRPQQSFNNQPPLENDETGTKFKKKKFNPYLDGGTKEEGFNDKPKWNGNKSSFIQNNNPRQDTARDDIDEPQRETPSSNSTKTVRNVNQNTQSKTTVDDENKKQLNNKLSALKMARTQVGAMRTSTLVSPIKEFSSGEDTSFEIPR